MLRAWLELARISNLPTVWTNVTAGWLLAGGDISNAHLLWLLLAGSLLYSGGMILNDAADVRFDREHRPERPIPRGLVSVAASWSVGLGMLVAGWCLAVFMGEACWGITSALVACILFYDFYHKPWPGAVWVMGMCRVLLFLMAASGEDVWRFYWEPALLLGVYIVGLTMVARQEAKNRVVSRWSRWLAIALLWAPAARHLRDLFFFDCRSLFPIIFAIWVFHATRLMRQGGPAIGRAVGILLAGIALVDALAVSEVSLPLAFGFAALAPVLRLWQRLIAAT